MKGRDILKSMVGSTDQPKADSSVTPLPHRASGAVKAMNLSLGRLNEEAAAAKALRESIASGDKVVELDAKAIETAFIRDRIPLETDPEFEVLKQSIRENGQQVPILVRPHPEKPKAYQAAYGHRRLRAASELDVPVRAIVKPMTDRELILAQGQENGARVDLSFIERALFARRMDEHGFDRDTIANALSIDKPETSRLLQVAQAVSPDIVLAIGPAPRVGRPRWLAFADRLKDPAVAGKAEKEIGLADFLGEDTNKRFDRVWKAITATEKTSRDPETIRSRKGLPLASFARVPKGAKITVTSTSFADFLSRRMAALVDEFEAENKAESVN